MTVATRHVSRQVLSAQTDAAFACWLALLRAQAATVKELSRELDADHGLTIADYEALMHLARAEDSRLRRVDLAERLLLTPSGVTRLLQGLEEAGLVEKGVCPGDARVTYAVLTSAGRRKLETSTCSHVAAVKALLERYYSSEELAALQELLERIPGGDDACPGACSGAESARL